MSRRVVDITNEVAPTIEKVRGANLNEIRVEIRIIYPAQATEAEIQKVLKNAYGGASSDLYSKFLRKEI